MAQLQQSVVWCLYVQFNTWQNSFKSCFGSKSNINNIGCHLMHRNIYTTNINNEVLSLSFAHCLKKHADFDVPESDRNNTQFNTFLQDSFCVSVFWWVFFWGGYSWLPSSFWTVVWSIRFLSSFNNTFFFFNYSSQFHCHKYLEICH